MSFLSLRWLSSILSEGATTFKRRAPINEAMYPLQFVLLVVSVIYFACGASKWTFQCPCLCDLDDFGRKRIICDESQQNALSAIPTDAMDKKAQVLIVMGSSANPLDLTLGRLFQDFDLLEEVSITYSGIPAIGDSSFWPGKKLRALDLSHNHISTIREEDFNGLPVLSILNLGDNMLSVTPSAVFRKLVNLTRLSLARNKLTRLVPRMFFKLEKLEHLDISENALQELHAEDIKDTKGLKSLLLAGCGLQRIHSLVYQTLPNLHELDLRDNRLSQLTAHEFKYLPKLKVLHLDGNKLHVIPDYTFAGIQLELLGLSRNEIKDLQACSFCNSSVKQLDISRNEIEAIDPATFKPLEYSLTSLHSEENQRLSNPSRSVYNMLRPLSNLRTLSISSMSLDDTLPETIFVSQTKSLRILDMSGNNIVNVSSKWFDSIDALEELDISQNKIYRLTEELLKRFDQLPNLRAVYMHENPWSCYRCFILPMLDWLSTSPPAYHTVCHRDDGFCVRCSTPADLAGRSLHDINEIQLEWCTDPTVQLRLATSEPRVGLVLAVLIIIVIVAIIVTIVVIYRKKQGAVYYTHEDERGIDRSIFSVEKSFDRNKSIMANSLCSPPFSPAQNSSPCSLSPPLSPSTPFRSQSLCSIPPPPPMPMPPLPPPFTRRQSSRAMETKAKIRLS